MEICKAPTMLLKALNKHRITCIMYIEMETLSAIKEDFFNIICLIVVVSSVMMLF